MSLNEYRDLPGNIPLHCYRVWFCDGSAMLIDAGSVDDAKTKALAIAPLVERVSGR